MAEQNHCWCSSCAWATGRECDCHPRVSYQPCTSTYRALHRSYANVMAKSSPFLITNVIVYANTVHLARDCLAPCRSLLTPLWWEGRDPQHSAVPPASAEAPAHMGRIKNLMRPKSASGVAQAVVLQMQQKNQKSINKSISSLRTHAYEKSSTGLLVSCSHGGGHGKSRWKVSYFI